MTKSILEIATAPNRTILRAAICGMLVFGLAGCTAVTSPSSGVSAAVQPHSVTLAWDPSASPVGGYFVYRSTSDPAGPYKQIASTTPGTTQYADAAVVAGETYYYMVASFEYLGSDYVEGGAAGPVSATIPSP